ncbi:MAG TPA: GGDEF domain-containing protein [Polyangiales bacterium]
MQEDWEDKTIISTDVALTTTSGRKRAQLIVVAGANVGEMYDLKGTLIIGRGREADIRLQGDGISRKHARLRLSGESAVLEDLGSTNGSFVNGEKISTCELQDGDKIQVGTATIFKFTHHDELDEDFQRQMFESASRDALTQIYNKRFFLEQLNSEYAYAARHAADLSLIMFDIDHFKQINDTLGHPAGDYVLSQLAQVVIPAVRAEDVFARYGGEEFAILSRTTGRAAGAIVAERVRSTIEQHPFLREGKRIFVTVSIGVGSMPSANVKSPDDLVSVADQALYQAKRAGRNRVVAAA